MAYIENLQSDNNEVAVDHKFLEKQELQRQNLTMSEQCQGHLYVRDLEVSLFVF